MSTEAVLGMLQSTLQQVSALAPSAISSLKSESVRLFGGDDGTRGDNEQPVKPAPLAPTSAPESQLTGQSSELARVLATPIAFWIGHSHDSSDFPRLCRLPPPERLRLVTKFQ